MSEKCLSRPAKILSDLHSLDKEYRAARWTHHRLLDIEDIGQTKIDEAAEICAPGIIRTGRIIAKLQYRAKRRLRTTDGQWSPNPHPELLKKIKSKHDTLKSQRNSDPRWKDALNYLDTPPENAPERKARRQSGETDEQFEARLAKRRNKSSKREIAQKEIYQNRRIHWSTFNALKVSVKQALKKVVQNRMLGVPSSWRRPKFDTPGTLSFEPGDWKILIQTNLWWTIELRLCSSWVRLKTKAGNWHEFDPENIKRIQLTRNKDGHGWSYNLTMSISDVTKKIESKFASDGIVGFDWGHREHGHENSAEGLRVQTWNGKFENEEVEGEILLPKECRVLTDKINKLKSRMDIIWKARAKTLGLTDKRHNRFWYRKQLMRSQVRTEDQNKWIQWETRYERQLQRMRKRVQNLRKEKYLKEVQELRKKFKFFGVEDLKLSGPTGMREQNKKTMFGRRKRQNRELSAPYEFSQICERYGAVEIPVPSRNSTRECPYCGQLHEKTAAILLACPVTGNVWDRDKGAARTIRKRTEEALANLSASI